MYTASGSEITSPGFPSCPIGIGVRLLARALAASSERKEPLPRTHAAAVVCESANILELFVEEHHVLRVALVARKCRPDSKVCPMIPQVASSLYRGRLLQNPRHDSSTPRLLTILGFRV